MKRAYTFSAGPATIPTKVLEEAQRDLLDYKGMETFVAEKQ